MGRERCCSVERCGVDICCVKREDVERERCCVERERRRGCLQIGRREEDDRVVALCV
jgi:hypothetical protein